LNQLADFLVDPKNPLRFIGGRVIANVRVGVLEQFMIKYSKGQTLPIPKIDYESLGRLLRLNQAAARGYMEDRIVDLYKKIEVILPSYLEDFQKSFDPTNGVGMLIPKSTVLSLFYPGLRFRKSVKLIDLNTLSFEELVDRVDNLEQLVRDFHFYKGTVSRKLILEDSFKILRIIMKSRRKGSLSFELTR